MTLVENVSVFGDNTASGACEPYGKWENSTTISEGTLAAPPSGDKERR
jgi:hypothetical protein